MNGKGITNTRGTKREDPHSDFCPTKIRSFASLRSQDNYAAESNANERDLENIFEEYEAVRRETFAMFNGFDEKALLRRGKADGNEDTVRALTYHKAGHKMHYLNFIREKYF